MEFFMKNSFLDKNHPVYKWIEMLTKKYELNGLIDEHIFCNGLRPKNEKEAEERVKNFFVAMGKKYNYTPSQAVVDIKKFVN